MSDQDEFYIGWQDEATDTYDQGRRIFFLISLLVALIFSVSYLFIEKKYVDNFFDYGNLTELEGTIVVYPVFGIKTIINETAVTVPLVGFGKFDALPVLSEIKEQAAGSFLTNMKVKLKGTLIQFQGKTWMELTEGEESIISMEKSKDIVIQNIKNLGTRSLSGEIVDPKCFFGVMNPAYGKIHRSCAIRCISGGIPPILAIKENGIYSDYYFVTDTNGMPLNQKILQYVGVSVNLSGMAEQVDDWKLIKMNSYNLAQSIDVKLDGQLAICALD